MTHFPENLAALRKRAGYTQETLAEALGVSRQAVGKWESGQGLPEAATLLDLADLLGCTLDQLMRQPVEEESPLPVPVQEDVMTWTDWARHMDRFAAFIALGVGLVLIGVALTTLAGVFLGESPVTALPVLVMVAIAVAIFIFGGIEHGDIQKRYPVPPACPDPQEQADFRNMFRLGIVGGVVGILCGVILIVVFEVIFPQNKTMEGLAAAIFLAVVALCVSVMTWLGILSSKYEPPKMPDEKERNISGAIMLTATAIYLLLGFLWNLWHPGWVIFPVCGILCGIIDNLRKKN